MLLHCNTTPFQPSMCQPRRHVGRRGGTQVDADGPCSDVSRAPRERAAEHGDCCRRNLVEQAHRAGKRGTRPRRGGKAFATAPSPCAGIALRQRLRTGPWEGGTAAGHTAAEPFYALAS
jgi:hypothetical protein